MKKILRILVIEDSEDDALLVLHQIKKGGYDIEYERVETVESMRAALKEKTWDIILSDYKMPHFNGLEALTILKESGIDIPFIIISGTIGEDVAVEMMKAGAHDYIMKTNLKRLLQAIERELRESGNRAERKLLEQKQKQAEQERLSNLHFFESMDKVNRAIQGAGNLEQMMSDLLDTLLSIFDCDRAFLMYPCDPEEVLWKIPMERTRPEYPGVLPLGCEMPMSTEVAGILRILLDSDFPVKFGPGTEHPLPIDVSERFGIKSFMSMALYPKTGMPWQFGIIQCSYPRTWTPGEERLIQEIGRRLTDTLTSLLMLRNLIESEERYRLIAENTADTIAVFDLNLKPTYISPSILRLRGYTVEEAMMQSLDQVLTQESLQKANEVFADQMTLELSGKAELPKTVLLELEEYCKNGSTIWVELAASFLRGSSYKSTEILTVTRDISERKHAEEALRQLNRELRAISNCNQTLLRAIDEQTLLNEICRTICDEAGYRLAWVGYAEHDENKTVRPVAWAGFNSGYLENSRLTWADNTEQGQRPAAKVIRSGELICIQDFSTDPQMAPWSESALQHGYRSGIALPLKDESENVFGVLLIYSSIPNAITPDEIRLMEELANDLAFGITALRIREERNKAESELQRSNDLLRAIIEAAPTAIFDLDLDGNVKTVWNPAAEKMLGWSAQEVIGHPFPSVPIEEQEEFKSFRERMRSGKTLDNVEVRRQKRDGTPIDYCIYASPLYDAEGCVTGNVAVLMDITERKRTENVILESERRFKELANLLPQTIYESDINGIITFANETALTTFGYSLADISGGISIMEMVSEKDKMEALENMQQILKGLPSGKNEYEMVRKDGTIFPALTFSSPIIRDGKSIGLRGTLVDITQRKLAENELRKLSEAVAQSPASIVITDLDGNIEYVNKTFEEIAGYSLRDVINRNPRILQAGHTKKEEYKTLWDTIISGKTWHGEFLNKKKNGELFWEDAFISPIKDKDGNTINYLAVKQDVTEKKEMTEELIAAKEQAERSDKLKSEFLAQMSHEIRTPMNVTINFANLIKEVLSDKIDDETATYFAGIDLAGRRLIRTVDLILNTSEMQVGTYSPTFEDVDLMKDILDNLRIEFSGYANQRGLEYIVLSSISEPYIYCDRYSVNQIFSNLIDNAIKYTPKGKVEVSVKKDSKGNVKVIVSDTGIGMSKKFMKRMFEPFLQEEMGYSRRYEGNGLGLALVKKYCDLNEATIEVKSEKDKGSNFIITFLKTKA